MIIKEIHHEIGLSAAARAMRAGRKGVAIMAAATERLTVIVGKEMAFDNQLPKLFPHADACSWFAGNNRAIAETTFRDSTLQCDPISWPPVRPASGETIAAQRALFVRRTARIV
ncbi:hypothetical protein J2797_004147 [Paraburkholderia terricola]|jgi:hypothetical protein|nr:hypothetical protein [Paraburkholderia terricola]MDR6494244.1 hypothetical protein [Paraburkholderia terricola]